MKKSKIALIEKENAVDYITKQYLIENDWNLLITKGMDPEESPWQLQQKMSDGQLRDLVGYRKVYLENYSKYSRLSI